MNADYARQVAAGITRDLARVIDTLQSLTAPETAAERLDGSGSVQDTGESSEGQQRTGQRIQITNGPDGDGQIRFYPDRGGEPTVEQRYEDLARAVCAATGLVSYGSDTGLKFALEALAEERDNLDHDLQQLRKRWHEAATQRDALVQAAKPLLAGPVLDHLSALREVLKRVEADGWFANATASRLRRELWHVLDRMPASDDNLIATVKKLAERAERPK